MKTLKFKEYKIVNENLHQEFLEPTRENIESFGLDYSKVKHNADGSIDYSGTILFEPNTIDRIPFYFNYVRDDFKFNNNKAKSLKGMPSEVGGNCLFGHNKLTSLKYSPKIVGENFWCNHNQLSSLRGGPEKIKGAIDCEYNNIIILNDYGKGYNFGGVCGNPIVIDQIRKDYLTLYESDEERFIKGLHHTWDEIENKEDFGKILETIIELEIEMNYPKEIIKYSNKFDLNLLKYLSPNAPRALKSKADTTKNIGWVF